MTQPAPPSTYILTDLHDVGLPDSVSWFPQTIGWKIIGFILFVLFIWWAYKKVTFWWKDRYRQEAIKVMTDLSVEDTQFHYKAFVILKQTMTNLEPSFSPLYGNAFIHTLEETASIKLDEPIAQNWLDSLASNKKPLNVEDKKILKTYCLSWLEKHQTGGKK